MLGEIDALAADAIALSVLTGDGVLAGFMQAVAMNEGYRWKKKLFSAQGTPFRA
jgi:hypothetical protein